VWRVFRTVDHDRSGSIDEQGLQDVFGAIGRGSIDEWERHDERGVQDAFRAVNRDVSGSINKREL
jgi:Ca2+-binding EF-hand superfamily protein